MPLGKKQLIVSLDDLDLRIVEKTMTELAPYVWGFRVGQTLINSQEAGRVAKFAASLGAKVLWDSNLHGTEAGMISAATAISRLTNIDMFSIHCATGSDIMKSAKRGFDAATRNGNRPLILGNAVMSERNFGSLVEFGSAKADNGLEDVIDQAVYRLMVASMKARLRGLIVSPQHVNLVRHELAPSQVVIADFTARDAPATSIIRAVTVGATHVVLGGQILAAEGETPTQAAQRIMNGIGRLL